LSIREVSVARLNSKSLARPERFERPALRFVVRKLRTSGTSSKLES
jgi:hypothetical protein